jgi:hypothetical protein
VESKRSLGTSGRGSAEAQLFLSRGHLAHFPGDEVQSSRSAAGSIRPIPSISRSS